MEAEEQLGHRQFSRTQNAWRQKNTCLFTARLYGENHTEKFQKCHHITINKEELHCYINGLKFSPLGNPNRWTKV